MTNLISVCMAFMMLIFGVSYYQDYYISTSCVFLLINDILNYHGYGNEKDKASWFLRADLGFSLLYYYSDKL